MKSNYLSKLAITILLFAFTFITVVNANTTSEMNVVGPTTVVTGTSYQGAVSCQGTRMDGQSGTPRINLQYGYLLMDKYGAIKYYPNPNTEHQTVEKFSCTFAKRNNQENVTYDYSLSIIHLAATVINDRQELTLDSPAYVLKLENGQEFTQEPKIMNNMHDTDKYFEAGNCTYGQSVNSCTFVLKSGVDIPVNGVDGGYVLKFKGTDGVERTINVYLHGKMDKGVYAYGGDGTCNWPNGWVDALRVTANNAKGNTKMYMFKGVGDSISLPTSCTLDEKKGSHPLPVKFEGWVELTNDGTDRQAINVCNSLPKHTIVTYEPGKQQLYGSCFTMQGVIVYGAEAVINDGNWSETKFGYYINKTANPVLPAATPRAASLNPNVEFIGYSTSNGSCSGTLKQPGEAAENGKTYYACVKYTTTETSVMPKNIKVGTTEDFTLSDANVKGCVSADTSYVMATQSNNKCVITGVKSTTGIGKADDPTDDFVEVKVTTSRGGTQLTLQVHVLADDEMPVIDWDEYTLDSSSGAQLEEEYGDDWDDVYGTSCGKFDVSPDSRTQQDAGIPVGKAKGVDLRVHYYYGTSSCDGVSEHYIGICMDPGRDEPASGDDYVKERDLDPKNNKFDRLISYIYTDADFLSDVNKYKNGQVSGLDHLVAATIAIRLGAIIYDEDANNNGLGLDRYYAAYKVVAENIKSQTGGDISKTVASHLHAGDIYFISPYDGIAAGFLSEAVSYEGGSGELKFTANDTVTEWNEDKTEYTKTISGTISGLNLFTSAALKMNPTCTGVFAGKCKLKLKNLDTQDYEDYSESINYFQNEKYMDRNGNLYYKFVIGPVSVSAVAADVSSHKGSTGGGAGGGNGAGGGGAGGRYDSVIDTRYASPEAAGNVVKTSAKTSANIQSLILFKDEGTVPGGCPTGWSKSGSVCCPDGYTYNSSDNTCHSNGSGPGPGGGTGPGGGGPGDDETVPPQPYTEGGDWSVELPFEAGGDSEPIRLVWIRKYYRIGTLLPACDINNEIFDYKHPDNPKFRADLFKAANCCNFVFDHTSQFYQNNCTAEGIFSSVIPVCTFNESNTTGYDVTKILEAHDDETTENYSWIISKYASAVSQKVNFYDVAGNKYNLDMFSGNDFCDVSCKEDWQFNFPSLNNYVGKNAVRAGSFFVVKDKNVFIGGKRTCVTTQIGHDRYHSRTVANAIVSRENYNHWQVKTAIKEAYTEADVTVGDDYTYCKEGFTAKQTWARCLDSSGNVLTGYTSETCETAGYTWDSGSTPASCTTTATCRDITIDPSNHSATYRYDYETVECNTTDNWCADAKYGEKPKKQEFTGSAMTDDSAGECYMEDPTEEKIREKVIADAGAEDPDSFKAIMQAANGRIASDTKMIKACDHFQMASQKSENGTGVQVMTYFSPRISFTYDEKEYMKEIGSNNSLVENETLNEACRTAGNGCPEVAKKAEKHTTLYNCDVDAKSYECGNKIEVGFDGSGEEQIPDDWVVTFSAVVCSAGGEGTAIIGASKESAGHLASWSSEDGCADVSFDYLKAHYIKRSIEQSSYYKSKYTWYINKVTDVKIYASSLAEYARLHPGSGADQIDKWSPFGTKQTEDSVFPVMVKTPRNMYMYKYTLTGIGMYSDATVGRLMGGTHSVFANNKRICFYEVVEQICRCCADTIDTHSTATGISQFENDGSDDRDISTAEALGVAGYDYQVSNFSSATVGSEGRLGYFGSTVTLADIMANRDATEVSSIWSDQSVYMVSGVDQISQQGDMLRTYIEGNGNKIYEESPEYSYVLTPSAMSSIRRYNEAYGYQPNANTLKMYGSILYQSSSPNKWLAKMYSKGDEVSAVHFSHYGSYFLEKNVAPYVTPDYKNSVLTNRSAVCYMIIDKNHPEYNGKTTKLYKDNGVSANYNECRWIDVVQETTNRPDLSGVEPYSRLAFK